MKKKKLKLTKETVKNLTVDSSELEKVAGGGWSPVAYTTTVNTGATCHSCGASCLACPGMDMTRYINPAPYGG